MDLGPGSVPLTTDSRGPQPREFGSPEPRTVPPAVNCPTTGPLLCQRENSVVTQPLLPDLLTSVLGRELAPQH